MVQNSRPSVRIDLNEFKLYLHLKNRTQLTLHFNSPSRRFYLSVIALVVHEMKKLGKIKSISLQEHLDLLALLNESIGGAAGSSEKENLLHRIYTKWKDALPNLEEAPLFKVLGKKKEEGEGAIGKIYSFTDEEKDGWANLFDYMGSHEDVRLKFAIDKIGVGLDETSIIFGDSLNGEAWDQFISSLKSSRQEKQGESEPVEETAVPELPAVPFSPPQERKISRSSWYRWVLLVVMIGIVAGAIWKIFLRPAPVEVASVDRMEYPLPDKPSIAVLPFVNTSQDPNQEFFCDGMTEDLITDLSKISGLLVIARNSAFTYKGKAVKAKQVAEELGVRYVLEGSVRREGDDIRINAQLIDAITGHHVWAERYDSTIKKIFVLQDQITQKIVSALALKLTKTEKETAIHKGTDNAAAYDEVLRGWGHYLRSTPEDFKKAVLCFKKATELDPSYGRAYAALSLSYWNVGAFSPFIRTIGISFPEARLRSREYLQKAMKHPSSIAHNVSSQMYLQRRQHKEAILELERALALDPNDPLSNEAMGNALIMAGRPNEAIDFIERGMRLDPHNPSQCLYFLGLAYFCRGELAKASDLLEKAIRLNPEITWYYGPAGAVYGLLGRDREARAAIETLRQKFGELSPLELHMYRYPFKERAIADRYAQAVVKAGHPRGTVSGGYFPAFKENQLTGEEIKALLFGSTITGTDFGLGEWQTDYKTNGEFTWRSPPDADKGKTRIEGDMLCAQYQKNWWGLEDCMTVFKNIKGSREKKDEYFFTRDIGFQTFSLAR